MKVEQIIDEMQASLTKLREHFRTAGTAGECTCTHRTLPNPHCPVHGLPKVTPDLPLHARVAKALGKDVKYLEGIGLGKDGWYYWNPHAHGGARWYPIPDYPNDLVAAMGALEEYCREHHLFPAIYFYERVPGVKSSTKYWTWDIQLRGKDATIANTIVDNQFLPQAICEAIVAHAERK